jgi:hypothetical protein
MAGSWDIDWDYRFDPDWAPPGSTVRPWFLMGELPPWEPKDYWKIALAYRPEKVAFVRERLKGVDREAALKRIIARVWNGARSNRERFERLIHFVQQMMIHPPIEQPLEADAIDTLRRECCEPTDHAEPYPEDLTRPWAIKAFEEAKAYGKYVGVWCSRVGQKLSGDWGLRGGVSDALELLALHEGRCGHQAWVVTQLAQVGGWRARLVQGVSHRYSELFVDGRWVLADTDMFAKGFIPTTSADELPSIEWMRDHPEIVNTWETLHPHPGGAAVYYGAPPKNGKPAVAAVAK